MGRNETDAGGAAGQNEVTRGPSLPPVPQRVHAVALAYDGAQFLAAAQAQGPVVLLDAAQWHFLDKRDIDAAAVGEVHQVQYLVLIATLSMTALSLTRSKPASTAASIPASTWSRWPWRVSWRNRRACRLSRLIFTFYAVITQLCRHPLQLGAVGREHQLIQRRQPAETLDQREYVGTNQRFAPVSRIFRTPVR